MEMKSKIAIWAFFITLFLFLTILLLGNLLNEKRENKIQGEFNSMYNNFNDMQMLLLMSETYGNNMTCIVSEQKLKDLDDSIWELGNKIDKYRIASEEFNKDPYYLIQKKVFNENEIFYFLLMKRMVKTCNMSKETILFFYQNSEECRKCDDQSFILSDINKLDDEKGSQEIAIFSFDMDLNISTINMLNRYYNINSYPCIVINEEPYCNIQDKEFILNKICENNPKLDICRLNLK